MSEANRRTLRTTVQVTLSLVAALPAFIEWLNLPPGRAAQIGAAVAVGAALVTRLVNSPRVDALLPAFLKR